MKPVKKFFVYKCELSLALLYLAEMFINKLKTKLDYKYRNNSQLQGSKLKKILRSPFGDQLEKYSRQM